MKKVFMFIISVVCVTFCMIGLLTVFNKQTTAENKIELQVQWKNTETTYNGQLQLPQPIFTNATNYEVYAILDSKGYIEPAVYHVKIIALTGKDADLFVLPENTSVEFKINRKKPNISMLPTASSVVIGDSLSSVILMGGESDTFGTFEWAVGEFKPKESGYQDVIFIPTDKNHFEHYVFQIYVEVKKTCTILFIDEEKTYEYSIPVNGDFLLKDFPALTAKDGFTVVWDRSEDIVGARQDYTIRSVSRKKELSVNGKYTISSKNGLTGDLNAYEIDLSQIDSLKNEKGFAVELFLQKGDEKIINLREQCKISINIPNKNILSIYILKDGQPEKIDFKQTGNTVEFESDTLGIFAIVYRETSPIIWGITGVAIVLFLAALIVTGIKIKKDIARIKTVNQEEALEEDSQENNDNV